MVHELREGVDRESKVVLELSRHRTHAPPAEAATTTTGEQIFVVVPDTRPDVELAAIAGPPAARPAAAAAVRNLIDEVNGLPVVHGGDGR